jgi:hypothetical protein
MLDKPLYILGVDLGQRQDYTALCVLERTGHDTGKRVADGWPEPQNWDDIKPAPVPKRPVYSYHYAARHLERLPLGTPYPAQVERVKALHDRLKDDADTAPILVVDQTGVGRPVTDMLHAAGLSPVAVTITGGDSVTQDGGDYRVPKRDLVSVVQILLDSDRLTIAERLKARAILTAELEAFKRNVSLKGHDSYGNDVGQWRENPHDDMVLAVALACWYGENVKAPVRRVTSFSFKTMS